MKKVIMGLFTFLFCLNLFYCDVFAAGVSIHADAKTVTIGSSFKVTVKANDCYATVFVSAQNGRVSGGAKDVDALGNATATFTITPNKVGVCSVSISGTYASYSGTTQDIPYSQTIKVNVINKSSASPSSKPSSSVEDLRSQENTLVSLEISEGKLQPSFQEKTTQYTIKLPADQSQIHIQAKAKDAKASVEGTGEKSVNAGKNTFVVQCTAENGSVRNYTLLVYVDEKPLIFTTFQNQQLGIVRNLEDVNGPQGFNKTTIQINDADVIAWTNEQLKLTVCYMQDENDQKNFYVVNEGKVLYMYKEAFIDERRFVIIPVDKEMEQREGLQWGKVKIEENEYDGWTYQNDEMKNYVQLYLMNEKGEKNIYLYEMTEHQLQKYAELSDDSQMNPFVIISMILGIGFIMMTGLYIQLKRK